ncbi:unnamed protein product [Dibothriocephalus latus]|uniref:BACK domain-containing protein n=1 Tax=Dibothriocephalus latus TaxID=60516 RepID=A0A3P7N6I4_DIBLA|nr:unnamed protein product [Dibothriocephalus latus]
MAVHYTRIISGDLFVHLPAETVLSLLRKDGLPVNSEEDVVVAISRWVCPNDGVDQQKLSLYILAILKAVRWCQTTLQSKNT